MGIWTERAVAALEQTSPLGARAAYAIKDHQNRMRALEERCEKAERQVRDQARTIERLKREKDALAFAAKLLERA
jgi:hypothetical protein